MTPDAIQFLVVSTINRFIEQTEGYAPAVVNG